MTSSVKYSMHMQDKNKFNNILKLYRNKGMMEQPRERGFNY